MRLKKDYWIAIICKFGVVLTEILITVFINRGLGIEMKGEYSYIIKIVEILYVFLSFGIGQVYATFKRSMGDDIRNIFVSLGLVHGVLTVLLGSGIVLLFKPDYGVVIVVLSAIAVVKFIISMIAVIEKSIIRNVMQVAINILYLAILAILFFTYNFSLYSTLICYALIDLIRIVLIMVLYKMKPEVKKLDMKTICSIYKMGFITMIVMLLISINYSIDTIMLKKLTNSYNVGIYSVGASLANIFLLIPDAFKEVLFGDSTKKDFSKSVVYSAIKVSLLISVIALLGFLFSGRIIIHLLYGLDYLPSYEVTIILFFGCFPLILFKILQPVYISHGRQMRALLFLACSAIMNVGANFILVPRFDSIGAAYASVLSYAVCGALFLMDYRRNCLDDK